MIYSAHRFTDASALAAARVAAEPLALDVIGAAYDAEGEPMPGWHANAVWEEGVSETWTASEIPATEAPRWWGGVPKEAPVAAPPTVEELIAAVDALVEGTAKSMDYKSAAHCAGYVTSGVSQWAAEAQAFVAWRDAAWLTVYGLDPASPPASVAEALALLPVFVRPGA